MGGSKKLSRYSILIKAVSNSILRCHSGQARVVDQPTEMPACSIQVPCRLRHFENYNIGDPTTKVSEVEFDDISFFQDVISVDHLPFEPFGSPDFGKLQPFSEIFMDMGSSV